MKQIVLFIFFVFQFLVVSAIGTSDQKLIDSLLNIVNTSKDDTLVVNNLNRLSRKYGDIGEFDEALIYSSKAKQKAALINYSKGIVSAYLNASNTLTSKGDYSEAMSEAIESLKISELVKSKKGMAESYITIGNIYSAQKNTELAMANYKKSLLISEEIKDVIGSASCYNNIGILYRKKDSLDKALNSYFKCLYILEDEAKKGNGKFIKGISASYNNIGLIYKDQGKYDLAIENSKKAYNIRNETNDQKGCASTCNNLGEIYTLKNDFETALTYLNKALAINLKIGAKLGTHETYLYLSNLYYQKQDYKKAFEYQGLRYEMKDQVFNEKLSKQITEINVKYDSEKKDRELIQKDAEIKIQEAEAAAKELERNSFIVGFVLLLIVAVVVFIGYTNKKSINLELNNRNELVEIQKKIVEEQNKKITSSINYANRIQKSILPQKSDITTVFPESFVFFRPKDIVSGDFYWIVNLDNIEVAENLLSSRNVIFAAADATGHGVPGALMGLMGTNMLEQIVKEHHVFKPSEILNELDSKIKNALKQTSNGGLLNEGIDIALCRIDPLNYKLEYAGAHNSLYIIRKGVLTEIKADKKMVGASVKNRTFTNKEFQLEKGDKLYLFTDGFADQKGGKENKKYFYRPFKDMLVAIQHLSMHEQSLSIERTFDSWKNTNEQIDDVLVMGIKIT